MEDFCDRKRARDDTDNSEPDSPEVKKLREDLLDFLDNTDAACPSNQDLDSMLRSLEEEISVASYSPEPISVPVVDLTSDSDMSLPNLGFLLEASDDVLGLPRSIKSGEGSKQGETELVRVSSGIGEFSGFDDQFSNYDSFDFATAGNSQFESYDLGSSDLYFDSSDFSDFSWWSETLPAQ